MDVCVSTWVERGHASVAICLRLSFTSRKAPEQGRTRLPAKVRHRSDGAGAGLSDTCHRGPAGLEKKLSKGRAKI